MDAQVIDKLEQLIKARDSEAVKKLAIIEANTEAASARLSELEQKMVRSDGFHGHSHAGKSLGEQFVASDAFKALQATPEQSRKGMRADHIVKATLTSLTTDAAGSVGAGIEPAFRSIDALPHRRLTVRDLLPQVPISTGSVEVPVEKVFTNGAATVAEGVEKPESDLQLELKTFPARVIAHWTKASRQILDDVPQLSALINNEMLYGLKYVEDVQLLNGGGTGQDLNGLYTQATASTANLMVVSAPTKIDVIGVALLQSALALFPADGIVLNPADWMSILLMKDTAGAYLFGPPGTVVEPRLFGLPVSVTPAMTVDKFLVGQFQRAATIYDRWEARVEVGFVDKDFTSNLVTLLCEERLALGVTRPLALTKGDFSDQITDLTS